jgi:hypothetical protein
VSRSSVISMPRARRCWPASGGLIGDDQHLGDAGRDRDRGCDQRWRGPVEVGAEQDVRARQHSQVGKILEIHQELPGRIHVVLIRQQVGF